MTALIRVEGLRVSFAGRAVVEGVGFELAAGECVALVGESGSGKSVSARSLLGLVGTGSRVEASALEIDGADARRFTERRWRSIRGRRIGYILQDALSSLDPLRTVGAEVREAIRATGGPGGRAGRERALELLRRTHVPDPETRIDERPAQLSGGQRQRALIATALAGDPAVLIADEPTTALDVSVQKQILALFAELKAQGIALLLISHDLAVVSQLADRVVVLQGGAVVEAGETEVVLSAPEHPYTRSLIDAAPRFEVGGGPEVAPAPASAAAPTPAPPSHSFGVVDGHAGVEHPSPGVSDGDSEVVRGSGVDAGADASSDVVQGRGADADAGAVGEHSGDVVLAADGVVKAFRLAGGGERVAVRGVSVAVRRGRSLGVVGESGSGKTTIARILAGFESADAGTVRRASDDPRDVQFVYQDPGASFDPRWTAGRLLDEAVGLRHPSLSRTGRGARVAEWLERVGLPASFADRRPSSLSGGQRQRLGIARALAVEPAVVMLDEPVSALDVAVQKQILDLIARLQRETGVAYLFISHDLGVIQKVCDEVVVLQNGEVREQGPTSRVLRAPEHPYTRSLIDAVPALPTR
ncbi:ABC transporter ATP-binding protein [uncultured Microbacterium sp.]|uniref:ABC transporter ATP-binding protein n=1 Tax=uncultured Microbacterium sp. TaxID=191216 RepID=UPI0028DC58FA|nr:ABC transporter ATP-binding protein [uncultured Microbacterium sp.]